MIVAHLPAGYIAAKLLFPRLRVQGAPFRPFLIAALLGAVAPDFDLLYFPLFAPQQFKHHALWPHFPILWGSLLLGSIIWLRMARPGKYAPLAAVFAFDGLVHMVLDTIIGSIWWFAPFVDQPYAFFTIPVRYHPWWLNHIFHWTFIFELTIVAWAIYLWRHKPEGGEWTAQPD